MRYAYMGEMGGVQDWLTGAGAIYGMVANLVAKSKAEKAIAEGKTPSEAKTEARTAAVEATKKLEKIKVGTAPAKIALYAGAGAIGVGLLGTIAWLLLKK